MKSLALRKKVFQAAGSDSVSTAKLMGVCRWVLGLGLVAVMVVMVVLKKMVVVVVVVLGRVRQR